MKKSELIIRDTRTKSHYIVDDEYLNGYAKLCGIYATGVYNVLCRHADFFTQTTYPSIETIAEKLNISQSSVSRSLLALEEWGIIKRERVRSPKTARWKHNSYTLMDKSTWKDKPPVSQTDGEPPVSQTKTHMSHRPTKDTHIYKDSHIARTSRAGKKVVFTTLGAEVIKAFEEVDPKNKTYYANTTQRAAADFLVSEYGFDEVKKRIEVLPRTNKVPYFPTITTPIQLRDKWVQLQDAVERKRGEVKSKAKVAFA